MTTPYRSTGGGAIDLPARFHAELEAELRPGEIVLWCGAPSRGRLIARALVAAFFPLVWNAFALGLIYVAAGLHGVVWVCAVPFLVMGLPLFRAPYESLRGMGTTFYVLTDQRVLLFDGDDILSYPARRIASAFGRERGDGAGDLVLNLRPARDGAAVLWGIPQVKRVERLLREQLGC